MKEPKHFIEEFARIKKMSYRQFEEWLHNYGYASYEMGVEYGNKEAVTWFEVELFDAFVKNGIDEDTADLVIDILLSKDKGAANEQ